MKSSIRNYFSQQVLKEAADRYQVSHEELTELDGFENFIYEFDKNGQAYILRITHHSRRTPDMIEAELQWIDYLHNHKVNCSLPLKSIHGNLVETIGTGDSRFIVCAFDKVPGKHITRDIDTSEFRYNYGKQIGRMHKVTRNYAPTKSKRIEWFEDGLVAGFEKVVPAEQALVIERMKENTAQIMSMTPNKDNYGLVHFDVHTSNFFIDNHDIYIYDFDDSQYAYFAADLAIVLFYFAAYCPKDKSREDFIMEFWHDFYQGYQSEYTLPREELKKIPVFLKQRELILYAAVLEAYHGMEYDAWANWYMSGRKEKLEQGIPYLDLEF